MAGALSLNSSMIVKRLIQILSAIGAIDAAYLTWQHITASGQCGGGDCNAVLSSAYATIFGLPVAVFGLGLYITLFYISTKKFNIGSINTSLELK